jgi:hypothetical protein
LTKIFFIFIDYQLVANMSLKHDFVGVGEKRRVSGLVRKKKGAILRDQLIAPRSGGARN